MPIYMQYDSLTKVGAGTLVLGLQANPRTDFDHFASKTAPRTISKVVFAWSQLTLVATACGRGVNVLPTSSLHSATPHDTDVLSILIALLIPFMAPGAQISFTGFQFDAAQTAKLSAAGGALIAKL
jgi:hypothetical protein